jgi:hypothetical protein
MCGMTLLKTSILATRPQYLPLNLSSLRVSLCFYLSSLIHKATASISITIVRIGKKTCKEYTPAGAGWDSFIDHTL